MLPPVAVQVTETSALSPVAVSPTATKSWLWFGWRVTFFGETTNCVMADPGPVTAIGFSQPNTKATVSAAAHPVTCLRRANRLAHLCMQVIAPPRSWKKDRAANVDPGRDRWRPGERSGLKPR